MLLVVFATILVTIVVQGLTLPLLVRACGLERSAEDDRREQEARLQAAEAAASEAYAELRALTLEAEREAIPKLRREGRLSSDAAACSTSSSSRGRGCARSA